MQLFGGNRQRTSDNAGLSCVRVLTKSRATDQQGGSSGKREMRIAETAGNEVRTEKKAGRRKKEIWIKGVACELAAVSGGLSDCCSLRGSSRRLIPLE